MVTLSDVARAAGVSLSTASRAINGSRDRTVKPHLRDRVLVAAAELNYSANATAQAMARGRTTTIGLMVHDITDPYFSGIAAGVTRAARDRGCVVTLATTDRQLSEQLTIIDVLRGQRVAALIMAGGLHDDPRDIGALAEALARFTESTGSNVTVIGQDRLGVATVGIGNHSGAKALAEALVAEGARRFAVLCGPPGNLTGRERLEGFVEGVGEARGGVVDELALDKALRDRRLRTAALDVLMQEPPSPDHPLLSNPFVTISPHNAGLTEECARRMSIAAAQNILDCFDGRLNPALVVNEQSLSKIS